MELQARQLFRETNFWQPCAILTIFFLGNGQSIANEPGQGWNHDAHWLMPRMGTGWRQSYTADEYGEGGYAQWPVDMQKHIVSVPDGQEVTLEMVQQNALAIKDNAAYYTTGKLDSKKNLIKNSSGGSSSKPEGMMGMMGDEDLDNDVDDSNDSDDSGSSNIKKPARTLITSICPNGSMIMPHH